MPARKPNATPANQRQLLSLPENRSALRALERAERNLVERKPQLLLLYGPTGVGKSALIAHFLRDVQRNHPRLRVASFTAAEFADKFAEASDADLIPEFQEHFRGCDVFVCEDLHLLHHRGQTQLQLLHCLDAIVERGGTVVLSATSLPGQWRQVDRRLVDRARGGLSLSVDPPRPRSRAALIQHFAEQKHIPIPAQAARLAAQELEFSPRELEGFVARLIDLSQRRNTPVTVDLVRELIDREAKPPGVTIREVTRASARQFGLRVQDLKSSSRRADIVLARQCAIYLASELTDKPHREIAAAFGKADHTAVTRATQKVEKLVDSDSAVRHALAEIRQSFRSAQT